MLHRRGCWSVESIKFWLDFIIEDDLKLIKWPVPKNLAVSVSVPFNLAEASEVEIVDQVLDTKTTLVFAKQIAAITDLVSLTFENNQI